MTNPNFIPNDALSRRIFQDDEQDTPLPPADTISSLRTEVAALQKQNVRLQQSLRLSSGLRQRFEALFDDSPLGLFTHDAEQRIVEANLTLAKLLQVDRRQLLGQHIGSFIAPAEHATFINHLSQLHAQAADQHGQACANCTITLLSAQQTPISVKLESTLQAATVHSRISLLENTDQQKESTRHEPAEEQARQHQQRFAQVARINTMGEMAAGLAHELSQPLTAIRSYTQSCLRLLNGGPEKQARVPKILILVNQQAKRASSIIQHLRDFVSKSASHREATQLIDIVRPALQMMQHEFRHHGINVSIDTAPNLPTVHADALQLEQVVLNLLRNASEAMRDTAANNRQLHIALEHINILQVRIAICDTGPGINAAAADKIATPFFSTKEGGMGLGLTISRSIVENHGGRLSHENNAQGGARFAFTLAINGQPPPSTTHHPET